MTSKVLMLKNSLSDSFAKLVCFVLVATSTLAVAQTGGSFTDRVQNAKARDSTQLYQQTKTGVDNWQGIFGLVLMLIGFCIMAWGIFWVMGAARSEGRKEAKPGWIMIVGGGVLGASTAVYLLTVGVFGSFAS